MQPINRSFETARGSVMIREALPSDVTQFRELRLSALQDSPTAFSADYQMNVDYPISFWEGRLKTNELGTIFFAEHDQKLIGMAGIRKGESPKTKHGGYIWGIFIRPEWRGLHIAEALIESNITWAKSREINIVKLGVVANNASAIRCYERCGFTTYGTEPSCIFYEGIYYDEYLMSRIIKAQ
ncbi:MAG: GNAT family N-acetyltransferase [Chloroflexota bacterium]